MKVLKCIALPENDWKCYTSYSIKIYKKVKY